MAIVQISKIQIRSGDSSDLPQLDVGELGWATDLNKLYIGNDPSNSIYPPSIPPAPDVTEVLTQYSAVPPAGPNNSIQFNYYGVTSGTANLTYDGTDLYFTGGNVTLAGNVNISNATIGNITTISTGGNTIPGTITGAWSLTSGSTLESTYSADLAEYYTSDEKYKPGTVLALGGEKELTLPNQENYTKIAGVVSTSPAYILNTSIAEEGVCIALVGRTPVNVVGKIKKGDLLVASNTHPGSATTGGLGGGIGRALESYDSLEVGQIEVMVGRF